MEDRRFLWHGPDALIGARASSEILDVVPVRTGQIAVLHGDDPRVLDLERSPHCTEIGEDDAPLVEPIPAPADVTPVRDVTPKTRRKGAESEVGA